MTNLAQSETENSSEKTEIYFLFFSSFYDSKTFKVVKFSKGFKVFIAFLYAFYIKRIFSNLSKFYAKN